MIYRHIDYETYGIMVEQLANMIKEKFDGVYAPPRGGLPIAVHMSHNLNIPLLMYSTKNSLIVDDISDTGYTLQNIKHKKIATLFSTDWTITKPDYFIHMKKNKLEWIVFPWEQQK